MKLIALIVATMIPFHTACSTTPASESDSRVYVFSYLIVDEAEKLSKEELSIAIKGHRSNIDALSEEGKLLIAGPLFEPLIGEGYSGIFVFDATTSEEGLALFSTDPAVQAKVFKPEMYLFECADPLLDLSGLKREEKAIRLADPDIPDQWEGRVYVLAIAAEDAEFERNEVVYINAVMTPIEGDGDPQRLLFLDFDTVDAAKEGFLAGDMNEWSFYGWYGTKTVGQMNAE